MKLLKKKNRTYLVISGTAFIIAGAITYFVLSTLLKEQLNEKLIYDIENVKRIIERNGVLPDYYPFIETRESAGQSEGSYEKKDTLIYDANEDDKVDFRQISLVYSINGKKYYIAARNELFENSDLLATIVLVIGSVFILLLISLYFINKKLSLNIWQPFYKTLDELKEFSYDSAVFRLSSVSQVDEFIELNKTLENLTNKVISDYQSLKRFTEDASHEIQNPIAIIQSKLETLLQYPELNKEQAELIKYTYSSAIKISKLTQTLLLLTKIANDQFPIKTDVNIGELINEKIKFFDDHISEKVLIVNKEIDPECIKRINVFLAESLVVNLIGNSVKHCISGGKIDIKLDKSHLIISNSGSPLPVESSELFERFFKINKSSDSHGLGLSIVRGICTLNQWEIRYEYGNNQHKFIIKF